MESTPKVFTDSGKTVCDSRELARFYGVDHDQAISRLQAALDIDPDCEGLFWEPDYQSDVTMIQFQVTLRGAAGYFPGEDGVPAGKFEALRGHSGMKGLTAGEMPLSSARAMGSARDRPRPSPRP